MVHDATISRLFEPNEDQAREAINLLASADYSLLEVAENLNTTVEALSIWMAKPEVEDRLANLESGSARHTRFAATMQLPRIVKLLTIMVRTFDHDQLNGLHDPRSLKGRELARRNADTARKCCALLIRLSRYTPGAAPPPSQLSRSRKRSTESQMTGSTENADPAGNPTQSAIAPEHAALSDSPPLQSSAMEQIAQAIDIPTHTPRFDTSEPIAQAVEPDRARTPTSLAHFHSLLLELAPAKIIPSTALNNTINAPTNGHSNGHNHSNGDHQSSNPPPPDH